MQTSGESQLLWWLALATAALVTIVVAMLLTLVLSVATAIDDEARVINRRARGITVSTVQLLYALRVNAAVASIVAGAGLILKQAGRVALHVQSCRGCPDCRPTEPPQPESPGPHQAPPPAVGDSRPTASPGPSRAPSPTASRAAWSWS